MKIAKQSHQKFALLRKMLVRMDKMLQSGEFHRLSRQQKRSFIHRIRRLMRQLRPDLSRWVRPAMIAALATFGIGSISQVKAQAFDSTQVNPFMLTTLSSGEAKPTLVDLDNDGDLDLVSGADDGNFYYAENIGNNTAPVFGTLQVNPFGMSKVQDYSVPDFVDIDNDGDLDLLTGQGSPVAILYMENIGTNSAPVFDSLQTNPFGISFGTIMDYETKIAAADLDNDGDFDIMVGTGYGQILYFENTGTASVAAFSAFQSSPFGISNSATYAELSWADLDGDGDLDLGISDNNGIFTYFENTGTVSLPAFAAGQTNPFGIQPGYGYTGTAFADLDGDNDLDLLKGVTDGNLWYQENINSAANLPPVIALGIHNDTICNVIDTLGPINFMVTDPDSGNVTVTATSSNQAVIQDADISVTGTAPNYVLTALTSGLGMTDIVITASDSIATVSDTLAVIVEYCMLAIDHEFFAKEFEVYPNPADNYLRYRLDLRAPVTSLDLEMVDLQGRVILSQHLQESGTAFAGELNTAKVSAGIYFLRVRTDLYRFNRKIVIE